MTVRMGISEDGKIKISTGSDRVRLDDLKKFLARNDDAILVKLEGFHDESMKYKPGHVCRIESDDEGYYAFVGRHYLGRLPHEALAFAEQLDTSPEYLVAMVGKVEQNETTGTDEISIYIAE